MADNVAKVALAFWRFGPYHHARLNAAGRAMNLFALEACGIEQTYAWDKVEGSDNFQRITLTDAFANTRAWRQQMRQRMSETLDQIRPDVVVVPGWALADALAALEWCVRRQVPAVTMSESTAWDERRKPWAEFVKRQIVGLCSAGLAGGTPHREYLAQLGMPAERVFLGYDAVDNEYFTAKAHEIKSQRPEVGEQRSANANLPPGPFFLASNRFIEKKNLPRLIQAYARYRQLAVGTRQPLTSDLWPLVLLGDGALRSDLCHLISDLSLQDCVRLPGFKQYPELPEYYARAGAFIHASTTEQWGLVVNEAMASGLPVLVSNRCGCARDLVQEGLNGFTFDPLNVQQMAELMLRISGLQTPTSGLGSQSSALDQMGLASQRIIANWGPDRFASGLKDAVVCARRLGPVRATLLQRAILGALLAR